MIALLARLLVRLSWPELLHHPWRNLAALLAVMLGVALAFSVQLINQSALSEFSSAVRAVNGVPDFELRGQRGASTKRCTNAQRVIRKSPSRAR